MTEVFYHVLCRDILYMDGASKQERTAPAPVFLRSNNVGGIEVRG